MPESCSISAARGEHAPESAGAKMGRSNGDFPAVVLPPRWQSVAAAMCVESSLVTTTLFVSILDAMIQNPDDYSKCPTCAQGQ